MLPFILTAAATPLPLASVVGDTNEGDDAVPTPLDEDLNAEKTEFILAANQWIFGILPVGCFFTYGSYYVYYFFFTLNLIC
uniref:Uncharacterized protein n=1 Tax=Anopheles darlingi TaxID=43151 RepID=A0A2M4DMI9_ANODA